MRRTALLAALAALVSAAACSRERGAVRAPAVTVPERAATAGDRVLALAPGGAEAVLEVDLARLRDNAAIGALVRAVTASELAVPDLIGAADLLVFCSYRIGETDAGQIVFAAGAEVERLPGARVLEPDLVAIAPPALLDRVDLVRAGAQPPLSADRALLRVRALAMPEKATGAAVRMSARLGFEGRLSLARRLELEAVPAWLSVWGDVADDLAAVALLGGDGAGEAEELARAVMRVRQRLSRARPTGRLGLRQVIAAAGVEVTGNDVRVVLVVGPRRLAALVEHVMSRLRRPAPEASIDGGRNGGAT